MFFFRSAFWMSKSDLLAHDLIAACIKSIVIATVGLAVMEHAKNLMEVYNKRRALVTFQNNTVENAISILRSSYVDYFGCTASVARFQNEECLTGLRSLRVSLDVQDDLVSGILGEELDALRTLSPSIDALVTAHSGELSGERLARLSRSAKNDLRSAIEELAKEIR